MLIGSLYNLKLALHKFLIKKQRLVIAMIVVKLLIGHCPIIPHLQMAAFCQHTGAGPAEYRTQSHFPEVFNRLFDHSFKSQHIPDFHRALF